MKKLLTLFLFATLSLSLSAQFSSMKFAGPSQFGVAEMDAWQFNDCDTIVVTITSAADYTADITMPAMTYNAMMVTIPSYTIHDVKCLFDPETFNVTIEDQEYAETIEVDGAEKAITGHSLIGEFSMAEKTISLGTVLSYGSMPLQVTYIISAQYVDDEETGIAKIQAERSAVMRDFSGQIIVAPKAGQFFIQEGKKSVIR